MNSRRKYSRFVFCFALSISVFFCTPLLAFADDGESTATVYVDPIDVDLVMPVDDLPDNWYQGAASIHTQGAYATLIYSNTVGLAMDDHTSRSTFEMDIPVLFRLAVERGHTYSGQIYFTWAVDSSIPSFTNSYNGTISYQWRQFGIRAFTQSSNYDGITVSYYGFMYTPGNPASASCVVCITFDNYQPSFTGILNINSMITLFGNIQCQTDTAETQCYIPNLLLSPTVASDFTGDLYDYPTEVITDSTGSLISNQTQQQQQIAEQQAQQSAQQHEDLKNGFQDDTYNSNVSNAGSAVDNYISVESDLMNSQNQIMSNYTDTAFNTGTIAPFTNAIAMCSTWYTWIWNSFADLNVAFVVVLAVGVACLIVGIKKRG